MAADDPVDGLLAAYRSGIERLGHAATEAVMEGRGRDSQLSAGLRAGLDLLAEEPVLAHLLLIEPLTAASPLRAEHERSLARLAEALTPVVAPDQPPEASRNLAGLVVGGLVSYLSGRIVAGETADLGASHDLLLQYLLAGPDAGPPRR